MDVLTIEDLSKVPVSIRRSAPEFLDGLNGFIQPVLVHVTKGQAFDFRKPEKIRQVARPHAAAADQGDMDLIVRGGLLWPDGRGRRRSAQSGQNRYRPRRRFRGIPQKFPSRQ